MLCSCIPLRGPWLELTASYGVDARDDVQEDGRWTHNALCADAVIFECGRLASAADGGNVAHEHAVGDEAACAALAGAAAAALAGTYVGNGDEGDHAWLAFAAPALAAEGAVDGAAADAGAGIIAGAGAGGGCVTEAELRAALGGALCPAPALRLVPRPLAAALDDWQAELAAGDEGADQNRLEDAIAPLQALRAAFLAGDGAASATYIRPAEGARRCGAVLPHFILRRTAAGGLAGVSGFTVYT